MSKIHAYDDLRDNHWDVIEDNVASHSADLHIGFTNEKPVVEFDDLTFGFVLSQGTEVIDTQTWPPKGVRYRRTDQQYIATHRLTLTPDTEYALRIWAENAGIRAERTHMFTTPRPAQPYESWTWDGETWNSPVPYPNDGGDWTWSEEDGDWVAKEGGEE